MRGVSCPLAAALAPVPVPAAPAAADDVVDWEAGDRVPAAAAPAGVTGACAGMRLGEPAPSLLPPLLVVRRWWRASADVSGPFMARVGGTPNAAAACALVAAAWRGPLTPGGSAGAGSSSWCGALLRACRQQQRDIAESAHADGQMP